jgi:glutamate synthase (NADPH/NADH) large chain
MTRHDADRLRCLIEKHHRYTGSCRAGLILDEWNRFLPLFVKVMPVDYRRALEEMQARWRSTQRTGVSVAVGY